jgi:hypothetical protein
MSKHSDVMYRCIRDCDAELAMRLWKEERPDAPQPENIYQATMMLHYARTQLNSMPHKLRFYSHAWLRDNNMPSALPDHLKSKAERMHPVEFKAVGIASGSGPGCKGPFNYAIEKVMSDAVLETFADGHMGEPHVVKARMMEKRAEFKRKA